MKHKPLLNFYQEEQNIRIFVCVCNVYDKCV